MNEERNDLNNNENENEFDQNNEELNENLNNENNDSENEIEEEDFQSDTEVNALKELNKNYENEISELKDKILRKAAEFENYKRRTREEQHNLLKYGAESFIIKILPVYDDLQRSIEHLNSEASVDTIKQGLEMVLNKFTKVLEEQGVNKIKTKGEEFDFNLHEALMQKNVEDVKPHTVLEEVEPGYTYKEKVIRHAKVIVSDDDSGSNL